MYSRPFKYTKTLLKPIVSNPHTCDIKDICIPSSKCYHGSNFIQAAFIDPGTVSCAFRIVRYHFVTNKIEVLWFGILKFGKKIEEILPGITAEITPLLPLFENCHYIVVEKQPLIRSDVFSTAQQLISFLFIHIANKGPRGVIIQVDPKLKTGWIGGPNTSKQNGGISIKKWSQNKTKEILCARNDALSMSIIDSSLAKGREDLSDVVCYEYAWWSYFSTRSEIPKPDIVLYLKSISPPEISGPGDEKEVEELEPTL